jgi:predicted amidohydrolase
VTVLRVAAVQASYVLMDRDATIGTVAELTAAAAREGGAAGGVSRGFRAGHAGLDRHPVGPVREREETLVLDLDLSTVAAARRYLDPVGHYNRPDIFRLCVDTSSRPAVIETPLDHLRSPS